ncbi:MAG: helix-turn-helix transcriptional regulator [Candidatus Cybelea sp.]|jgi:DNA-binding PadR family transcriptional regulator
MMPNSDPHRELFILGLLRRQPLSAYAVDKIIRDHLPLYRRFRSGNLYQFVERLSQGGLLLRRSVAARRGPRECKVAYRLSSAGEARFRELLRRVIVDVQSSDAALETAFVLLGQLARDEALGLMQDRMREIEAHERRLKRLFGEARERGGAGHFAAAHAYHRASSERRFLQDALKRLNDRKWEPGWVLDDGPITDVKKVIT